MCPSVSLLTYWCILVSDSSSWFFQVQGCIAPYLAANVLPTDI